MSSARIARDAALGTMSFDTLNLLGEDWRHLVATYVIDELGTRERRPINGKADLTSLQWSMRLGVITGVRIYGSDDGNLTEEDD
jgi:hypothetical protein